MKISSRQIYFFLACVTPVAKLVLLPTTLAYYMKNDLLWPVLAHYLLQAAVVFCVLLLAKRETSFYDLLKNTFGRVIATILICIYALFLFYVALLPLLEQKLYVQSVFYDTLPSLMSFAPFFVFSVFVCAKPLFSHGRVWDILAPLAIVGYLGILFFSLHTTNFSALLPVGSAGFEAFLQGTMSATSWFYDGALLLVLVGKFEYKKGMAWKGTLFYLAGALAAIFFFAVFYGIFGETSIYQLFAFTKTSSFFPGISVLGRIDYIFIIALSLIMAFFVCLPLQAGIDCILQAFGRKKGLPTILSVIVNGIFFALIILLDYRFGEILKLNSGPIVWLFPVFGILIPILCLLLRRNQHESA